jgi:parallel beta-helix repeat protein
MKVAWLQAGTVGRLAASMLFIDGLAASASADTPMDDASVQSPDRIWGQIKQAQPGQTVEVAPGTYAPLKLDGMKFPRGITITSADKSHPAVIKGLNVTRSEGLTFKSIEFVVNPAVGFAVMLGSDNDIRFDHVAFRGASVGDGNAIMVRNSSNVSVTGSEVHHLGTGINHLNSDHLTFSDNFVHDIQSDGIRGGGSSFVTISGNRFTDFFPKPQDHPDAIQFWTRATSSPTHDLAITDNIYVRGSGERIQGIFVGNEDRIPFQNVDIERNKILGGMYHGISIGYGDNITIKNNVVRGYDDMTSWIMMHHTTNSSISDNEATTFQLKDSNSSLVEKHNKLVGAARPKDAPKLTAEPVRSN